jgi:RNA polymerase sigma-70 factor (ECF subfamily)
MRAGYERPVTGAEQLDEQRQRVAAAQSGDEQAWRELFDEFYPRLYGFMRARGCDRETAEDLAAEVFVDALRGLPRFRWRGTPFGAWLFKIARNRLLMHYRAQPRGQVAHLLDDTAAGEGVTLAVDASLGVDVRDALARLPRDYRMAIELRYVVGLSGMEAAAAMGRSHGAFRMLVHRAVVAFKLVFEDERGTLDLSA